MQAEQLSQLNSELFEVGKFWRGLVGSRFHHLLENEKVLKILANQEIIKKLKKYDMPTASSIAYRLCEAAEKFMDEEVLLAMSRAIGKYEGETAGIIASALELVLPSTKENVIRVSKILAHEEVAETIRKYERYGDMLSLPQRLSFIACELKDEESVIRICRIIRGYEDIKDVKKIISCFTWISQCFTDPRNVLRVAKMCERVGRSILTIDYKKELPEIINNNLDWVITDEKSLEAVLSYLRSGKRLPMPTRSNIENYEKEASEYLKRKYRIIVRGLDEINKLMMLTDEEIREIAAYAHMGREYKRAIKNAKRYPLSLRDDLLKYAVVALVGSENEKEEQEAYDVISSILGKETLNAARDTIDKNYVYVKYYIRDGIILKSRETGDEKKGN